MNYPVGKLLTREYDAFERKLFQIKIFRSTDDWGGTVRFVCKDGSYGYKKINEDEMWEIGMLIQWASLTPYCMYLRSIGVKPDKKGLDMFVRLHLYNAIEQLRPMNMLAKKYKWLYDTETWEETRNG